MRSLVAAYFLVGAAEVVNTTSNRTASCQCALWSLRPFQLSSLWRWSCDGKSTRIARPPSRTTAYRSFTVQPSQCHRTPGSAVPFAPFWSPLFSSRCAIFVSARCSTYSATSFSRTMYLSENFLIASLSPQTSSLSSNNRLIWARGWKSSGSRHWWGLHSKRDDGTLVACHSRDMVVELEVERW